MSNFRQEERECFGFRLAQFREQLHVIRMRAVRATNYPSKRIPHGARCVRWPAGIFWLRWPAGILPQFAQMLKLWVDKKLPNPINMLRYDLTHWLIYSHVGSLFKFWLCGYCIFAIVTRLAGPLANSRREEKGVLVFRLAQFRHPGHNVGSLFKLWLCTYAVFTIATRLVFHCV